MIHPQLDRSTISALFASGAIVLVAAACSNSDEATLGPELQSIVPTGASMVTVGPFEVCKEYRNTVGPPVTIDYTVDYELNQGNNFSGSVDLADGECYTVHVYDDANSNVGLEEQTVTVTEQVPAGFNASYQISENVRGDITVGSETPGNSASGIMLGNPDNGFKVVFYNDADPILVNGRMTGGGRQVTIGNVRVTRGLTLHCDNLLSNNLEINWTGGNKWHIDKESLTSIECIDDPAFDETPPRAPFNTFIAQATGSLNGVAGSIIRFKFIDDGEPGSTDEAYIQIWTPLDNPDSDTPVLAVGGVLTRGNLQAHFDQPHK